MGIHNFVKVGNFWSRSIQLFCLLWAPQEFQNMFSCGSQILVGTGITWVAWLKKKKKATLHGSNPRYTDVVDLWQDPRTCIFNKQWSNSTTRGLGGSTMPHSCGGLRHSPLLPSSLIRYPDIVLRTKGIKVLLGSPSLLVMSLMPLIKKYDGNNYKISYHLLSIHSVQIFLITIILQGCYHQPHLAKEEIGLANNIKPVTQDVPLLFQKPLRLRRSFTIFQQPIVPLMRGRNGFKILISIYIQIHMNQGC